MKNKKKILVVITMAAIAVPALALAQWTPDRYVDTGLPDAPVYIIIKNLMMMVLAIFGFIGIIGFAIAGIWYLTAAGDEDRMQRGKNAMMWSIIGVIVGLMGLVILYAVDLWLWGSDRF
jgi:hypothetical protein